MGTTVSPGNIREFAKFVGELADEWEARKNAIEGSDQEVTGPAAQYAPTTFPGFGELEQSSAAKTTYENNVEAWSTTAKALHDVLTGLQEACDNVAEQYESAEARNSADAGRIQSMLGEELATDKAPTNQPTA